MLDAKNLYYLACLDTYRDGKVDPAESAVLARLRESLALGDAEVEELTTRAREDLDGGEEGAEPLEARKLYETACRIALLDDTIEYGEAECLTSLAEALDIPFDEATAILEELTPDTPEPEEVRVGDDLDAFPALTDPVEAEAVVWTFHRSWQEPVDLDGLRTCLAEDFVFDGGSMRVESAEAFVAMVQERGTPWREVKVLASTFGDTGAAVLYEGTCSEKGSRHRISEHLELAGDRIKVLRAVVDLLD